MMLKKIIFILLIASLILSITNIIFAINPSNVTFENLISTNNSNEASATQEDLRQVYTTTATDYDSPFELSITNIINIILIAVGIVLILLGIAIILKNN